MHRVKKKTCPSRVLCKINKPSLTHIISITVACDYVYVTCSSYTTRYMIIQVATPRVAPTALFPEDDELSLFLAVNVNAWAPFAVQ